MHFHFLNEDLHPHPALCMPLKAGLETDAPESMILNKMPDHRPDRLTFIRKHAADLITVMADGHHRTMHTVFDHVKQQIAELSLLVTVRHDNNPVQFFDRCKSEDVLFLHIIITRRQKVSGRRKNHHIKIQPFSFPGQCFENSIVKFRENLADKQPDRLSFRKYHFLFPMPLFGLPKQAVSFHVRYRTRPFRF